MPEKAPGSATAKAKNPFDVPSGRWKAYAILAAIALISALAGVGLGVDLLAMAGLMAALFLAVGVIYSYMNEKGL